MDKKTAKNLDKILKHLYSKSGQLFEILDKLKIDKKNKDILFNELDSRDFIEATRMQGGNHFLRITPAGKVFIQSDLSFLRLRKNTKTKHIWTATKQTIMVIGSIISTIGTVLTIYLGILNYYKNGTINELNSEINILKQENKQLKDSALSRQKIKTNNETKK